MSETNVEEKPVDIHAAVREHYGKEADRIQPKQSSGCSCSQGVDLSNATKIYPASLIETLPEEVTGLSLGCGDPITLAALQPGQTVLDLGSGGGIDCFMAARKVGETGHVVGVDMTAEMLEKARANQVRMGFKNVEFRLGEIEHLPVADNTVDVIISNCVVNLSPDKPQVFREAYRVLRPGGKFAVSDTVTSGPLPEAVRESLNDWAGCIAGSLQEDQYVSMLKEAGFSDIKITRNYFDDETVDEYIKQAQAGSCCGEGAQEKSDGGKIELANLDRKAIQELLFSANITAYKS